MDRAMFGSSVETAHGGSPYAYTRIGNLAGAGRHGKRSRIGPARPALGAS